ncbi:DUF4383 domain-containing protein [Nocardia gamkensis]|uniref:DUF4383 domain-containing protein n=1 Tax=Nocardia gamkensis TaxID=352869 RepID=UPI0036E5BB0B
MIRLRTVRRVMTNHVNNLTNSPIQFGIWTMAVWFTTNGIFAYLIYPGMFSSMTPKTTILFGFVPVTLNLCHTACHFVTGLIGLVAVRRRSWSIACALIGTVYYIAWGILGLVGGQHVRHHLGVDVFGSWVHVVEGLILFLIWFDDHRRGKRRAAASTADQLAAAS